MKKYISFGLALAVAGALLFPFPLKAAETMTDHDSGYSMTLPEGYESPVYDNGSALSYSHDGKTHIQITCTAYEFPLRGKALDDSISYLTKEIPRSIKKNGEKLIHSEKIDVNGVPAIHTVSSGKGKGAVQTDRYDFMTPERLIEVSMTAEPADFQTASGDFSHIISTFKAGPGWKKASIPNTAFSLSLPGNMIVNSHPDEADHRSLIAAGPDFLFSVAVRPVEGGRYSFLPQNLDGADEETVASVESQLGDLLSKDSGGKDSKAAWKEEQIAGHRALCLTFDDSYGHNAAYIFVLNGQYLSFEFVYDDDKASTAVPLMEETVRSIDLGPVGEAR